jgi:multiple sugar transport system ATP-binding protein
MTMGDRIVVMKDGKIQQIDQPLNLYANPVNQFVAGFIGSPAMNFIQGRIASDGGGFTFDEGGFKIPLPEAYGDDLRGFAEGVVFGIRPEDIHDSHSVRTGRQTAEISAKVEVVEPMGSDVLLHLTAGKSLFVARVDPQYMPQVGQQVELAVDVVKAHFFDPDDGSSLLHTN